MNIEVKFYNDQWQPDPNGLNFRALHWVELDTTSQVIKDMWLRCDAAWGSASYTAYFDVKPGTGVRNTGQKWIGVPDQQDYQTIPSATRRVWIEGRRESALTHVVFGLLPLGR